MNYPTWWVTCLTATAAEAHERRTRNISPETGLGWTPYRFKVEHGAIAHTAFHTVDQLRAWLIANSFRITRVASNYVGCRTLFLERFKTFCADCNRDITGQHSHECRQQRAANARHRRSTKACGGTYYNGPGKRFARCNRCLAIDYEKNEGDSCRKEAR